MNNVANLPVISDNKKNYPTVSYSEISVFNSCRMKHYYVYTRQLEKQYFDPKPVFGSMGHAALQAYYAGADWRDHLLAYTENEIARQEMFEETEDLYFQMADLCEGVVSRYIDHYAEHDRRYKVRAVEQKFEATLKSLGRALGGYWDALVEDEKGRIWIRDYKFVGGKVETDESGKLKFRGGGQFRNDWELELDLQLALYQWAAIKLGIPVFGTIYDQIKAATPKVPEPLKNGKGLSRARITTDWPTYSAAIEAHGFDPQDYMDVFGWASQTEWFRRTEVIRQPEEIEGIIEDVRLKVREMKRNPAPTLSPHRGNCTGCQFRDLCLEHIRGRDIEPLVGDSYQPRSRRSDSLVMIDEDEEEDDFGDL